MAMTALAKNYGKGPLPMSSIASTKNIPLRFLEGILLQLKNNGLLRSSRGIDGGYFLERPPEKITLKEIVEVTEGSLSYVSCLEECATPICEFGWDMENCGIRSFFSEVFSSVDNKLSSTTLSDLI